MNTEIDFQRKETSVHHDDDYFSSSNDEGSDEETFTQFESRTRAEMDYYLEHEEEILRARREDDRKNHVNKVIQWQGPSTTSMLVDKMNNIFKTQKEDALKKLAEAQTVVSQPSQLDGKLVWNNVKACEPIQEVEEEEPVYKHVRYPANGGRLLFRKQPSQEHACQPQRLLFRKQPPTQQSSPNHRLLQRNSPTENIQPSPEIDRRQQKSPPQRFKEDRHPIVEQRPERSKSSFAPNRMCHFQNRCKRTNCEFAHSFDELVPIECRHVMCHYFSTCRFYHKRRETKQQYVDRVSKL